MTQQQVNPPADNGQARSYFTSYEDLSVHELMLKDAPRMQAYKSFFEENSALFRNKVVLDVGAGTGILSLFAASVGARKVYAVEASQTASLCEEIVKCNGFEEVVQVYNCPVEELELPAGTKVDVLVSEWMGFYLLHESMLDSVIHARDKYLSPDGIMAPSKATLFVAPTDMDSYYSSHIEYWRNVHGFDFSPAISCAMQKFKKEPIISEVKSGELLAKPQKVIEFDLRTVDMSDVRKVTNTLNMKMDKSGILRGFVSWFDVEFRPLDSSTASSVVLSTSPNSSPTHWKQTLFVLPEEILIEEGDEITSIVELVQDEANKRHYNISIELLDVEDEYSGEEHEIPCDCDAPKCRLIKKVMETYDDEQRELETEAENVNINAEAEAVRILNSEMSLDESDKEDIDT